MSYYLIPVSFFFYMKLIFLLKCATWEQYLKQWILVSGLLDAFISDVECFKHTVQRLDSIEEHFVNGSQI